MSLIITENNPAGAGVTAHFAADGKSLPFTYNGVKGAVAAFGNIGGGTLTIEISLNGGATYVADPTFSITGVPSDPIYLAVEVPAGLKMRFSLDGSTSPDCSVFMYQGARS